MGRGKRLTASTPVTNSTPEYQPFFGLEGIGNIVELHAKVPMPYPLLLA